MHTKRGEYNNNTREIRGIQEGGSEGRGYNREVILSQPTHPNLYMRSTFWGPGRSGVEVHSGSVFHPNFRVSA